MLSRRVRRASRTVSLMPTIRTTTSGSTSSGSSHSVNMPSGIVAGDLLLILLRPSGTTTFTAPSGWTQIYRGDTRTTLFAKAATGSEGSSLSWTSSGSVSTNYVGYRVDSWKGSLTSGLVSSGTSGTSGNPNPPNLASGYPTGSNVLWIACAGGRNTHASISAYPSGYTLSQLSNGSAGFAAICAKESTTLLTDDPGEFTDTGAGDGWVGITVAVKGP